MARGINKVILIGNLGQDPDTRFTGSGSAVTNLNVATDESYKDKQTGQMVPKTEWHRVVLFNRLAEIAKEYLRKGSKVYLEGRLQTRKWQDQNGQDRYTTEIVANEMQMLDSRQGGGYEQPMHQAAPQQQAYAPQQAPQQAAPMAQQNYAPAPQHAAPQQAPAQQPYSAPQSQPQAVPNQAPPAAPAPVDDFDDDIPF